MEPLKVWGEGLPLPFALPAFSPAVAIAVHHWEESGGFRGRAKSR